MTISKQFVTINGHRMAYVERGAGVPVVLLHGNPTSSYLWRNIIPPLSSRFRCLAPDLIGMGDSERLSPSGPDRYTFAEHRDFLDGWIDAVVPAERLLLVVHDWGSALGFDWMRRHPERTLGVAYMEAIVGMRSFADFPEPARALFRALRSPAGEELILQKNLFVETLLPGSILRTLSAEEHAEYRRPFAEPGESRRPTLSWPRQLPIEGEPAAFCEELARYTAFMARTPLPKLFINAEPGRLLTGALRDACRRWPNQREVTVRGLHYVQEDSPAEITEAICHFAESLE